MRAEPYSATSLVLFYVAIIICHIIVHRTILAGQPESRHHGLHYEGGAGVLQHGGLQKEKDSPDSNGHQVSHKKKNAIIIYMCSFQNSEIHSGKGSSMFLCKICSMLQYISGIVLITMIMIIIIVIIVHINFVCLLILLVSFQSV